MTNPIRGSVMVSEQQKAKLPKWAQTELRRLERNLEDAEKRIAATLTEAADNHPSYGDYGDEHFGRGLPCRRVRFKHGPSYIEVYAEEGRVVVRGDRQIAIEPAASNTIYVRNKDDQ